MTHISIHTSSDAHQPKIHMNMDFLPSVGVTNSQRKL